MAVLSSKETILLRSPTMGRRIDVDDLLTASEVAGLLGLSMRQVVSTYARRYEDFPRPAVIKSNGRTQLWAREDVETWDRLHRPGTVSVAT